GVGEYALGVLSQSGLSEADDPIFVNYDKRGEGLDLECLKDFIRQIDIVGPIHVLRLNECFPDLFVVVRTDAHQLERSSGIFLVQIAQDGNRFAARWAPGAPEIHEHNLAAKRAVRNRLIVVSGKRKLWHKRG